MAQLQTTGITGSLTVPLNIVAGNYATGSILNYAGVDHYGTINTSVVATTASIRTVAVQGNVEVTGSVSGRVYGGFFNVNVPQSNVSSVADLRGAYSYILSRGSSAVTTMIGHFVYVQNYTSSITTMRGLSATLEQYGSGTTTTAYATHALTNNYGSGTMTTAYAIDAFVGNRAGGVITDAAGIGIQIRNYQAGTITNAYGVSIGGSSDPWGNLGAGSITNSYGIYIAASIDVGATSKYAIYSLSTSNSYLKGNLGIGVTSPTSNLFVSGTANVLAVQGSGSAATSSLFTVDGASGRLFQVTDTLSGSLFSVNTAGGLPVMEAFSNNTVVLGTYGSNVVYITGSNVGLGTAAPAYRLELSTDSAAKPSTNTWTISSDERIKENIRPYTKGLDAIAQINPVEYDYNGKAGFAKGYGGIGIIAQEIQNVVPEGISTYKKKLEDNDENETELYNFNSHPLTYILINAIKELKAEIEELKRNN